jgi:hypothetical protein
MGPEDVKETDGSSGETLGRIRESGGPEKGPAKKKGRARARPLATIPMPGL